MMAREGILFVLIGLSVTVIVLWLANKLDSMPLFALTIVAGVLTLLTAFFFRDPERTFEAGPGAVVAPADGKIVGVKPVANHPFVGDDATRVSIFLSIFDVHVNRLPASGQIDYVRYNPGRFFAAFKDKASALNEQTEVGMTTTSGIKLVFKQIAGLIARRIVCRLSEGERVDAGSRFGMIRFGSRVDLVLPKDSRLLVKPGDRVKAGKSVIGYLPDQAEEAGRPAAEGKEYVD